uniref:Uncharacterized protein n=1 Tax=Mycena chlorophos TaxID=658473 RepID=A0ABQ0LXQ3_MYCCL|nr:predicted protein [Mycena chlorophos]
MLPRRRLFPSNDHHRCAVPPNSPPPTVQPFNALLRRFANHLRRHRHCRPRAYLGFVDSPAKPVAAPCCSSHISQEYILQSRCCAW